MSRHFIKFIDLKLLAKGFCVDDLGMDKTNRFYLARIKTGLSQTEVAERLGLNKTAVSKWEGNKTIPDPAILIQLVTLYNVSADYLLNISPESQLFDDARIERPEIMELYDLMTPQQQSNLINYARGMLAASASDEQSYSAQRRKYEL